MPFNISNTKCQRERWNLKFILVTWILKRNAILCQGCHSFSHLFIYSELCDTGKICALESETLVWILVFTTCVTLGRLLNSLETPRFSGMKWASICMVITRIKLGKFYKTSNIMPIHCRYVITISYVLLLVVEYCGDSEEVVNDRESKRISWRRWLLW